MATYSAGPTPSPTKIVPHGTTELLIGWTSGDEFAVPYTELRFECPCANCVDEHTGQRIIRREQVKADVRPVGVDPVGRYAVCIRWSDGHATGIYHFDTLRKVCEAAGKSV